MTRKKALLTNQSWSAWVHMAEGSLTGASQMAWQNKNDMNVNRTLFGKVTDREPTEYQWKNSITWFAASLLALSAEQSMKALVIKKSPNGECRKTHDLECLWKDLQLDDRRRVAEAAQRLKDRTRGTRFDEAPYLTSIKELAEIACHHKNTFEDARYYLQTKKVRKDLTKNLELWKFALSLFEYARIAPQA